MKKRLTTVLCAVSAIACNFAFAFDISSIYSLSYSGYGYGFNQNNQVSSRINIGLISTSFNDSFSRLVISGTETNSRLLEAAIPVDKAKIEKYVDDNYSAIPEQEKNHLKETLIKAKETDELLKSKMASPSISDDVKIGYGLEREKLRTRTWEHESKLQDKYAELFKPIKYSKTNNELSLLTDELSNITECFALEESCVPYSKYKNYDKDQYIKIINNKIASLVVDLVKTPVEPNKVNDDAVRKYIDTIKDDKSAFDNYLKNLYSNKGDNL